MTVKDKMKMLLRRSSDLGNDIKNNKINKKDK